MPRPARGARRPVTEKRSPRLERGLRSFGAQSRTSASFVAFSHDFQIARGQGGEHRARTMTPAAGASARLHAHESDVDPVDDVVHSVVNADAELGD